jgi:hypothetical protein
VVYAHSRLVERTKFLIVLRSGHQTVGAIGRLSMKNGQAIQVSNCPVIATIVANYIAT